MDDFEMSALFAVGVIITAVLAHLEYIYTNNITGRSLVPFALLLIYMLGCYIVSAFTDPELHEHEEDEDEWL